MVKKIKITWVQVMALIALFGILLGVIGTAWIAFIPVSTTVQTGTPVISAEVNL